eukprot:PhF_6_TR15954/c0_g1_i1/m.24840
MKTAPETFQQMKLGAFFAKKMEEIKSSKNNKKTPEEIELEKLELKSKKLLVKLRLRKLRRKKKLKVNDEEPFPKLIDMDDFSVVAGHDIEERTDPAGVVAHPQEQQQQHPSDELVDLCDILIGDDFSDDGGTTTTRMLSDIELVEVGGVKTDRTEHDADDSSKMLPPDASMNMTESVVEFDQGGHGDMATAQMRSVSASGAALPPDLSGQQQQQGRRKYWY